MKKILIILTLLSSCVMFKAKTATCTQDSQFYYDKNKVESLKILGVYPPVYEIKYLDGTTEIYYGSCHFAYY